MNKIRYIILLSFLCSAFFHPFITYSQYNGNGEMGNGSGPPPNEIFYPCLVQAGGEIIYPLSNKALQESFGGIYAANLSFDISILKRLFVGIELHDDEMSWGKEGAQPLYDSIITRILFYMGGIRIGYHSSTDLSSSFIFNAVFTGGEAYLHFTNVIPQPSPPKGGYIQQSPFGKLNIAQYYRITEQMMAGLDVSLTYLTYQFNPNYIGLQNQYPYLPSDYKGATSYIGWGFQFLYFFSKK